MDSRQWTVDGGRLVAEGGVQFVGGGECVRECGRWTLRRGGVPVSWFASQVHVCVEDVIALGRAELMRAFGYVPEVFEVMGEPVRFVNDVEWVLWMFGHATPPQPSPNDEGQSASFGEGENNGGL